MSSARRTASPGARAAASKTTPGEKPPAVAGGGKQVNGKVRPAIWWMLEPLTPSGLEHIATHKYKAGKYTPLDNALNPWWTFLTELLPIWLAPNLVTFVGLVPLILTYGLTWWVTPFASEPSPSWLLLTGAFALFFYQTMDAMDGKQARRTGASTPLGQLFDHGCDCLALISHHSMVAAFLAPGGSVWGLLSGTVFQTGFFVAQWEEYHTGILQTSAGWVGVTETQYFVISLQAVSGLMGHERLSSLLVNPSVAPISLLRHDVFIGWVTFVTIMVILSFFRTFRTAIQKGTVGVAIGQLLPILALNIECLAVTEHTRYHQQRMLMLIIGLHFFFLTAQMILFSMAHQEFPVMQRTLVPFGVLVALSHVLGDASLHVCMAIYALALGAFVLRWLLSVITQITWKLNIEVFRITKPSA